MFHHKVRWTVPLAVIAGVLVAGGIAFATIPDTRTGAGRAEASQASDSGNGDWPTIEHDPGRSGTATDETRLGAGNVASLTQAWSAHLDGKVTAQPLYLSGVQVKGTTHDVVIAATNQNTLYALDTNTGSVLWSHHLLPPPPAAGSLAASGSPVRRSSTALLDGSTR